MAIPGRTSGTAILRNAVQRDAPSTSAASSSDGRQVGEERVHDPDRERQVERQVGDDQPPRRAEQVGGAEDHEQRQHDGGDRRHARRDDPERDVVLAAEAAAREAVAGERAERHGDDRRDAGGQDRVDGVGADAVAAAEQRLVVLERRREGDLRRRGGEVVLRLERGHQHPQQRHERPQQHARPAAPWRSDAAALHRASPRFLSVRMNRFASRIETASIESPMAAA